MIIEINNRELRRVSSYLKRVEKSLGSKWLKSTLTRNARPMINDMRQGSHSARLMAMIGSTTAKRRRTESGIRIGVIKNVRSIFPDFSSFALASVIEYGTQERFRSIKKGGLITGQVSTGFIKPKPFLRPAFDRGFFPLMNKVEKAVKKKIPA